MHANGNFLAPSQPGWCGDFETPPTTERAPQNHSDDQTTAEDRSAADDR